jgi:hypothetical protein
MPPHLDALDERQGAEMLKIRVQFWIRQGLHVRNSIMSARNGQETIPDSLVVADLVPEDRFRSGTTLE